MIKKRLRTNYFLIWFPYLLPFLIWELLHYLRPFASTQLFPSIFDILRSGWQLLVDGTISQSISASFLRVCAGFFLGSFLGLLLGIVMALFRRADQFLRPLVAFIMPVPAIAWIPLLIIWFGIQSWIPIVVIVICSLFPVAYSTRSGILSVNQEYIDAARIDGAGTCSILRRILLPLAAPQIMTGVRIEAGMAWKVVIAAEMLIVHSGLGSLMMTAESLVRTDVVVLCILCICILCQLFELLIHFFEKKLLLKLGV
jgi:NitT/TauT family transport system permease protein